MAGKSLWGPVTKDYSPDDIRARAEHYRELMAQHGVDVQLEQMITDITVRVDKLNHPTNEKEIG